MQILARLAAELLVLAHLLFVVFVVAGGLLVAWRPKIAWLHLPCAAYGAAIEFVGWVCPLTPLENWLRLQAGAEAYNTGFIEHYLLPVLYPAGLTRTVQLVLGTAVVLVNAAVYLWIVLRRWRSSPASRSGR